MHLYPMAALMKRNDRTQISIFSGDYGVTRSSGNANKTSHHFKTQQQQQQQKDIQHHHNHHHHQHNNHSNNQQMNSNKIDTSDGGAFVGGHHHQHQHHHQQQQQQQQQHHPHQHPHHYQTASGGKPRKSRNHSKRQDDNPHNNNNNSSSSNNNGGGGAAGGHNMVYCYDRHFIASCVEDKHLLPRAGSGVHRDSTSSSSSSDMAGIDDLHSTSSNEDLSNVITYSVIAQAGCMTGKKSNAKARHQNHRQQQQQSHQHHQQHQHQHQQKRKQMSNGNREATPMDVDEESFKENQHPTANGRLPKGTAAKGTATVNANINLRKQAALKVLNKQTKGANRKNHNMGGGNALSNSTSVSSVCSTLSSASSTMSLPSSMSSSASSSPSNSANCSPTASPTASKRNSENFKKIALALSPDSPQGKLNLAEYQLAHHLRRYVIDPNLLRVYGYPVESAIHEGCIEIYKCLPKPLAMHIHHRNATTAASMHHAHTRGNHHRGMYSYGSNVINANDGLVAGINKHQWTLHGVAEDQSSGDSGQGSGDSSPPSVDSDSSEVGEDEATGATACYTPDGSYQIFSQYDQSHEKQCVRCKRNFHVTQAGDYITPEQCVFHWGKLYHMYTSNNGFGYQYSCCQGDQSTEGCTRNPLHVWTGAVIGINGPYTDFVHTRSPRYSDDYYEPANPKVYALDCEMSFTGRGLEVTKVTVVAYDGELVYEHFVRPHAEIVDYNTRFSGITERDLCAHSNNTVKTLPEVQRDLLQLFDADTILIGHGLDNDLRVLRIVHKTVIDTSISFPHLSGFPYRRALKHLTKVYLNRDIQVSDAGHSSFEDSRACLDLMLWRVRRDLRQQSNNNNDNSNDNNNNNNNTNNNNNNNNNHNNNNTTSTSTSTST